METTISQSKKRKIWYLLDTEKPSYEIVGTFENKLEAELVCDWINTTSKLLHPTHSSIRCRVIETELNAISPKIKDLAIALLKLTDNIHKITKFDIIEENKNEKTTKK